MSNVYIMPAFHRHPKEAAIIGRLIAHCGDLELNLCHAVAMANGDLDKAVRDAFGRRGERERIKRAAGLGRGAYSRLRLKTPFEQAITAMGVCLTIRNQYAHCQWHDSREFGLGFVNLEELPKHPVRITDYGRLTYFWIDVPTLEKQEAYFAYTQALITYLAIM